MEKYLIAHCAPTLASLKTASLFCFAVSREELSRQLAEWNTKLQEKGIFLTALRFCGGRALVYVCRRSHLRADLRRPGVARFLAAYGYTSAAPEHALARLRQRIQEGEGFPHEIGIFLGLSATAGKTASAAAAGRYTATYARRSAGLHSFRSAAKSMRGATMRGKRSGSSPWLHEIEF